MLFFCSFVPRRILLRLRSHRGKRENAFRQCVLVFELIFTTVHYERFQKTVKKECTYFNIKSIFHWHFHLHCHFQRFFSSFLFYLLLSTRNVHFGRWKLLVCEENRWQPHDFCSRVLIHGNDENRNCMWLWSCCVMLWYLFLLDSIARESFFLQRARTKEK